VSASIAESAGVVEDDAERVTMPCADAAHAMSKVDPIHASSACHGTLVDGEDHGITLTKRDDFRSRLHARALLRNYELTAREVSPRL
jgi:hypothetical protein